MTFIICASFVSAVAYFVFALVARLHNCLMVRYRHHLTPAVELDFAALSAELNEEMKIFETALFPVAIAQSTTPSELPTKIRELRDYIRANKLQSVVKERIGKTVSKCSKDELMAAIA
jgi:hypothetical protein